MPRTTLPVDWSGQEVDGLSVEEIEDRLGSLPITEELAFARDYDPKILETPAAFVSTVPGGGPDDATLVLVVRVDGTVQVGAPSSGWSTCRLDGFDAHRHDVRHVAVNTQPYSHALILLVVVAVRGESDPLLHRLVLVPTAGAPRFTPTLDCDHHGASRPLVPCPRLPAHWSVPLIAPDDRPELAEALERSGAQVAVAGGAGGAVVVVRVDDTVELEHDGSRASGAIVGPALAAAARADGQVVVSASFRVYVGGRDGDALCLRALACGPSPRAAWWGDRLVVADGDRLEFGRVVPITEQRQELLRALSRRVHDWGDWISGRSEEAGTIADDRGIRRLTYAWEAGAPPEALRAGLNELARGSRAGRLGAALGWVQQTCPRDDGVALLVEAGGDAAYSFRRAVSGLPGCADLREPRTSEDIVEVQLARTFEPWIDDAPPVRVEGALGCAATRDGRFLVLRHPTSIQVLGIEAEPFRLTPQWTCEVGAPVRFVKEVGPNVIAAGLPAGGWLAMPIGAARATPTRHALTGLAEVRSVVDLGGPPASDLYGVVLDYGADVRLLRVTGGRLGPPTALSDRGLASADAARDGDTLWVAGGTLIDDAITVVELDAATGRQRSVARVPLFGGAARVRLAFGAGGALHLAAGTASGLLWAWTRRDPRLGWRVAWVHQVRGPIREIRRLDDGWVVVAPPEVVVLDALGRRRWRHLDAELVDAVVLPDRRLLVLAGGAVRGFAATTAPSDRPRPGPVVREAVRDGLRLLARRPGRTEGLEGLARLGRAYALGAGRPPPVPLDLRATLPELCPREVGILARSGALDVDLRAWQKAVDLLVMAAVDDRVGDESAKARGSAFGDLVQALGRGTHAPDAARGALQALRECPDDIGRPFEAWTGLGGGMAWGRLEAGRPDDRVLDDLHRLPRAMFAWLPWSGHPAGATAGALGRAASEGHPPEAWRWAGGGTLGPAIEALVEILSTRPSADPMDRIRGLLTTCRAVDSTLGGPLAKLATGVGRLVVGTAEPTSPLPAQAAWLRGVMAAHVPDLSRIPGPEEWRILVQEWAERVVDRVAALALAAQDGLVTRTRVVPTLDPAWRPGAGAPRAMLAVDGWLALERVRLVLTVPGAEPLEVVRQGLEPGDPPFDVVLPTPPGGPVSLTIETWAGGRLVDQSRWPLGYAPPDDRLTELTELVVAEGRIPATLADAPADGVIIAGGQLDRVRDALARWASWVDADRIVSGAADPFVALASACSGPGPHLLFPCVRALRLLAERPLLPGRPTWLVDPGTAARLGHSALAARARFVACHRATTRAERLSVAASLVRRLGVNQGKAMALIHDAGGDLRPLATLDGSSAVATLPSAVVDCARQDAAALSGPDLAAGVLALFVTTTVRAVDLEPGMVVADPGSAVAIRGERLSVTRVRQVQATGTELVVRGKAGTPGSSASDDPPVLARLTALGGLDRLGPLWAVGGVLEAATRGAWLSGDPRLAARILLGDRTLLDDWPIPGLTDPVLRMVDARFDDQGPHSAWAAVTRAWAPNSSRIDREGAAAALLTSPEPLPGGLAEALSSGGRAGAAGALGLGVAVAVLPEGEAVVLARLEGIEPRRFVVVLGPGRGVASSGNVVQLDERAVRAILATNDWPTALGATVAARRTNLGNLSPFQVGGALPADSPVFVGRKQALDDFRQDAGRAHVVILGPRRIGKTSLLHRYYAMIQERADLATGYLDGQGVRTEGDLGSVRTGADRATVRPDRGLASIHGFAADARAGGRIPILMFNEIDGLVVHDPPFIDAVRGVVENDGLQLVVVGYASLAQQLALTDSPLFNLIRTKLRFRQVHLGVLGREECDALVDQIGAPPLVMLWASDDDELLARSAVFELSQGIPWAVQELCDTLVRNVSRQARGILSFDDVRRVASGFDLAPAVEQVDFATLWNVSFAVPQVAQAAGLWLVRVLVERVYFWAPNPRIDTLDHSVSVLSFDLEEATTWLNDALARSALVAAEVDRMQGWWGRHPIGPLLDGLGLTLLVAPVPGGRGGWCFPDHIYPRALARSVRRTGRAMSERTHDALQSFLTQVMAHDGG